jgi:hypothetical protein
MELQQKLTEKWHATRENGTELAGVARSQVASLSVKSCLGNYVFAFLPLRLISCRSMVLVAIPEHRHATELHIWVTASRPSK